MKSSAKQHPIHLGAELSFLPFLSDEWVPINPAKQSDFGANFLQLSHISSVCRKFVHAIFDHSLLNG